MNFVNLAILGCQAVLGLVGLAVGGAKVTHQENQVEDFQRFGYPQWFRIATGVVEIIAGIGLLGGLLWWPELAWGGGLLLSGVMIGAVMTHIRTGDPPSKTVVPAVLFVLSAGVLTLRYSPPV